MFGHEAGRRRGGGGAAHIAGAFGLATNLREHPFEIGLDEGPCAHVLGLFLTPDHIGLLEARHLRDQSLQREGIELLHAKEIDIVQPPLLALFVEVVIDLARAQDDATDLVILHQLDLLALQILRIIPQQAVERGARRHFAEGRDGALVAQQRLGRHENERLADVALDLSTQDVEVVRRRGAVGDLHVVLGAELEIALQTSRRMLRSLALIAMRQQADEARHAQPLALARRDELVEEHLRAIGEIAELGFPHDKRIGLGEGVAIFEAEHRLFREHRIDDLETGLPVANVVQRHVARLRLLIDQHRMALGEGAALAILPRQTHAMIVIDQCAEGERLGHGPINPLARLNHLVTAIEEALDGLVHIEAIGNGAQLGADLLQLGEINARLATTWIVRSFAAGDAHARPAPVQPVGLVGLVSEARLELGVKARAPVGAHLVDFALGDDAFADQLFGIDLQRRLVRADLLVHQRLGEAGLIALVMAVTTVAEHVDDYGLVEPLTELDRDLGGIDHRLGIIAINMDDRRLDHLRHIGGIGRGARVARVGGEANLVIDDEMQGAAGAMALEARQTKTFRHHALARKGRIAVDQQRHDLRTLDHVAQMILLGAHLAEHHGIGDFQMGRIGDEGQMDPVAIELTV